MREQASIDTFKKWWERRYGADAALDDDTARIHVEGVILGNRVRASGNKAALLARHVAAQMGEALRRECRGNLKLKLQVRSAISAMHPDGDADDELAFIGFTP